MKYARTDNQLNFGSIHFHFHGKENKGLNQTKFAHFKSLTYVFSSRRTDEVKLSSQLEDLYGNKNYDQNKKFIHN